MNKIIPASLFFVLYLSVLILVAVWLILGSISPENNKAIPVAVVQTSWENQGSPLLTEQQITNVLERKLSEVPELASIRSSSDEKRSIIEVFSSKPDESGEVFSKVKEVLAGSNSLLPQEVSLPQISRPLDEEHVLFLTLETNFLSPEKLRRAATNEIATSIDALPEVQQTVVLGGQESVLRICPNAFRMLAAGIDRIELQHEVSRLLNGNTGSATGTNDFFEALKNLALVNSEGNACSLKDLCDVSIQNEWHPGFSGRKQNRAVILRVYGKKDIPLSLLRGKIMHRLGNLPIVANRMVTANPFIANEKPAYRYISPIWALLICAFAFFVLLLLGMMTELSNAKKIWSLSAAAIVLTLISADLFALKQESDRTGLHFSIAVPDNLPREGKEALALRLAEKITQENEVQDLIWYGNSETTETPVTENKIKFYIRLTNASERDQFIKNLRKMLAQETGIRLAGFSPVENGFPQLYQAKIEGPEWEQLKEILLLASKKIEGQEGVSHIWTLGDAVKPAIEWQPDRSKMGQFGVSLFSIDGLPARREFSVMHGVKCIIGCEQENENEAMRKSAVTNSNGQQIPLSDFAHAIKVAYPKAIYHENRQRCMHLYWMADEAGTAPRIKKILSSIPLQAGYTLSMTKEE